MKYALIGCGRIATNHIKAVIENNLEIVAVCDILEENMENLLKKHGIEKENIVRYTDYNKMIKEQKFDLVAIATESGKHAKIAVDCIKQGINLIIEKPIALSIADADLIINTAKKCNVKVCACHQNRFNIAIQHIREAVEEGRFGKLSHGTIHVRWNRSKNYYDQAKWRGTWEQDGGALMNQSIHGIDLLRWMMGDEIDEVFAYTANRQHDYIAAEDIGVAVIKFKNGAVGTIEGTTNIFPENLEETLYIFGEKGTVKAGGKSVNTIDEWKFSDEKEIDKKIKEGIKEETSNVYGNGHTSLYKDVIESLSGNKELYVDANAGKRALELVLAIYKSRKTGMPISFPLSDFTTLNMIN